MIKALNVGLYKYNGDNPHPEGLLMKHSINNIERIHVKRDLLARHTNVQYCIGTTLYRAPCKIYMNIQKEIRQKDAMKLS